MSTFRVQDMTCGHCEKTIKKALSDAHPEADIKIDLEKKQLIVENLSDDRVVFLLQECGYNPEKIKH
jgi:copper chaperone